MGSGGATQGRAGAGGLSGAAYAPEVTDAQPSATEWVASFATLLGVEPPTSAEVEALLELAGVAAHASERVAAPLACWLVGRTAMSPAQALETARQVSG